MNRLTSVYLDLIRFLAALVVLLVHARHERFTSGWLASMRHFGIDAVMVFFVLSGFVIAYCADEREKTWAEYAVNRLSRLYSVVIPALVLTVVLDYAGRGIDPQIYETVRFDNPIVRVLANLIFVNQLWFIDLAPLSNGPFWSLGYEPWYYLLFGIFIFTSGPLRIALVTAVLVLIGPKIILLMPIWALGVVVYRVSRRYSPSLSTSILLFAGSFIAYIFMRQVDLPLRLDWNTARVIGVEVYESTLGESRHFLRSYVTGSIVAINFLGIVFLSKHIQVDRIPFERAIRFLASFTFTLYLLHYPLLNFFAAALNNDPNSVFDQSILLAATLGSVVIVGMFTEWKKDVWRSLFKRAIGGLGSGSRHAV